MKADKFTPGPWVAHEPNGKGMGWKVGPAWLGENTWEPECEANAHLIAAAPDMLAACQLVMSNFADYLSHCNGQVVGESECVTAVREAIAKATGA